MCALLNQVYITFYVTHIFINDNIYLLRFNRNAFDKERFSIHHRYIHFIEIMSARSDTT